MPINFDKIKRGLKDGLETAKDGIEFAAEKSSKTIEIQKNKAQIMSINSKIKGVYCDLGKEAYALRNSSLSDIEELKEFFNKIDSYLEDIKQKELEIEMIKNEDSTIIDKNSDEEIETVEAEIIKIDDEKNNKF